MTVRAAKFVDISAIVGIMERAHKRSRYANCTFDQVEAKQALVTSIQRHGHANYGGTLMLVSETDGVVHGFMWGLLDNPYPFLKELRATDLYFIFEDKANPRDAIRMVRQLVAWARNCDKVVEVFLGVTDGLSDWERTSTLYRRIGLEQCGALFRMVIDRSEQGGAACRA